MNVALRRRHAAPSLPWLFGALGGVVFAFVAVGLGGRLSGIGRHAATHDDRVRALRDYEEAIAGPTRVAGEAIVAGIRPDIPDFRSGHISPLVWRTDMEARGQDFAAAWSGFRQAPAPASVRPAGELFDDAFRTYLLASRALYEAGTVDGDARAQLISAGASLGDQGDTLFDEAAAVVQRAARALGLPLDNQLPDKETQP